MREIQLTLGQIALVDDEDFEHVNSFGKWQAQQSTTGIWYAVSSTSIKGQRIRPMMHRFVLKLPPNRKLIVDHINRIGTDNRKENLRVGNQSVNLHNAKMTETNISGATGVSFVHTAAVNRWRAIIYINKKAHHLGYYPDVASAAEAYRIAKEKFWLDIENQTPITWEKFDYSRPELFSNNSTGFNGVAKHGYKYRAYVIANGSHTHLGTYATPELANQARLNYLNKGSA